MEQRAGVRANHLRLELDRANLRDRASLGRANLVRADRASERARTMRASFGERSSFLRATSFARGANSIQWRKRSLTRARATARDSH